MFKLGTTVLIFFLLSSYSFAQQILSGKVIDKQNSPLQNVSVTIIGTSKTTMTNAKGEFSLRSLPEGHFTIKITAIGYNTLEHKFSGNNAQKNIYEVFTLHNALEQIEQIDIIGRSENEKINRQAYNVTAIDAKKFYNTTMDISQALNRVSGVRVRESGGMGSNINLSLNGFSGNQVKLFIDGLPMSNFGSSFQLNNIPINFAERVEVYRGVVPVWLGGDALGGAINIVTRNDPGKYLDASYSFGSFNTHKTTVNAGYVGKSGFTFQLSAFQNYSDNNYWVNVDIANHETGQYTYDQRVRQFHNTYHNETLVANIGVSNKKYADQFLVGITLGQNKKEIQTGNNMQDVYGGRETQGNIVQPSIKYLKKDLFTKGLTVSMTGRFNLGKERSLDTVPMLFNWDGVGKPKNPNNPSAPGGEVSLQDYRYRNNNGVFSANISYDINERNSFVVNHQFTTFNRKGQDRIFPDLESNNQPKKTEKNITGLGYRYAFNEKWNANIFAKHYAQRSVSHDVVNEIYYQSKANVQHGGYGVAATYFIMPDLQLKSSFERAIRLPENNELFGDVENQSPNTDLKPEKSYNFNFGASYFFNLNESNTFSVDGNYIFRDASDYIRAQVGAEDANGRRSLKYVNLRKALNNSIDFNLRYYYKNLLSFGGNITYQNLINNTQVEPDKIVESSIYKDRLPNIPYKYGNLDANIYLQNILEKGAVLSIGYNLLYVNEFFLDWPSFATPSKRLTIPNQLSHDVNLVYSVKSGRYNIALECLNITDATRYDNFALQKPSRSFNVKLRYFIKN